MPMGLPHEEQYSNLLTSISDAVIYTDAHGVITLINPVAERLTGWTSQQAIGQQVFAVVQLKDQAKDTMDKQLAKVLREDGSIRSEEHFIVRRQQNTEIPVKMNTSPIRDKEGTITGSVLVFRDNSDRKELEKSKKEIFLLTAFRTATEFAQHRTVREALHACTEAMVEHLDAAFARIWTMNTKDKVLELQASSGLYTHTDGNHSRVPLGQFKIGRIASEKRPHLTNSVLGDPRVHDQEWAKREGMVAFAGYPLLLEGRVVGVLAMFSRQTLENAVLEALRSAADRIAYGIERGWKTEALKKSEERFRLLVEGTKDFAIFFLNPEGIVTSWNEGGRRIKGYEDKEIIGKHMACFYTDEDRNAGEPDELLRLALEQGVVHSEGWRVRKDGSQFWATVALTTLYDQEGRQRGFSNVTRDITDRKQALEELHSANAQLAESEASYRSLFENALYGIAITGPDFKFMQVNEAWCQLIGYTEDELVNKMGIADVTVPDRFWESKELIDKLVSRQVKEGRIEKPLKTKSGDIIDAIVFIKGMYDEQGRYLGSAASVLDITDRKRAEEALRKHQENLEELVAERTGALEVSEAKYRILYHNSPALMISVDVETKKIVECNETLLKELGYVRDEVIGKEVWEFYHPDSTQAAQKVFQQFMATDEVHGAELQLAKKDGQKIDVLLDVTAHIDKKTGKKRTLSTWRDITERKRMEGDLLRAKDDLEVANVRLLELDQLKSMFIATMSHELRTPLNSIISFSGILLQNILGEINPRQRDSLKRIERSGQHLLALITDVIDISKIEAGRVDVHAEDVNVEALVGNAIDNVRLQAEEKGLHLEVTNSSVSTIRTDSRRLLQCLVNLLSNAVKYTERGRVSVRVRSDEDTVTFEIRDTGIGIPAQALPKIFQAFERVPSALQEKVSGTGLGLYLTRRIAVGLLQGDIAVKSVADEGSTFTLTVARVLAESQDPVEIE